MLVDARLKYPYEHSTVRLPGRHPVSARRPPRRRCRAIATSSCTTRIRTSWPARDVAAELIRQGYRAVALKGGIVDWLAANLPTETKEAPQAGAARTRRVERLARRFLPIHALPFIRRSSELALLATIRGDCREAAMLEAAPPSSARAASSPTPISARSSTRRAVRRRPAAPSALPAHVRSRRLGAPRIGDRRPARRPALAVRIGRGHARAARRRSISTLGATTAADLAAAVARRAIRAIPGLDEADRGRRRRRAADAARSDSPHPARPGGRASSSRSSTQLRARPGRRLGAAGRLAAARPGHGRRHRDRRGRRRSRRASSTSSPRLPDVGRVLHRSERRLYLLLDRVQVGVRFPEPVGGRRRAASADRVASPLQRVSKASPRDARTSTSGRCPPPPKTRSTRALGLPFIPPEIRNGDDEIRAAREGAAAGARVARRHPRRSAHALAWSDGRDSIEAMVSACRARLRVPRDHRSLAALGGVAEPDGRRRRSARPRRSRRCASGIPTSRSCTAARSTSCRTAGSISPTASSSSSTSCSRRCTSAPARRREQLMRRYLAAMKHPLVTLITHPTNRLRPAPRGYDLDYDRSSRRPSRPARSSRSTARRRTSISTARSRGARSPPARRVAIDSDCHRAELLDRQMDLGVIDGPARLGRAAARAEHAPARRGPRAHRAQARP